MAMGQGGRVKVGRKGRAKGKGSGGRGREREGGGKEGGIKGEGVGNEGTKSEQMLVCMEESSQRWGTQDEVTKFRCTGSEGGQGVSESVLQENRP